MRIQTLILPSQPDTVEFALVIDGVDRLHIEALIPYQKEWAELVGAKAVLFFAQEIEVL